VTALAYIASLRNVRLFIFHALGIRRLFFRVSRDTEHSTFARKQYFEVEVFAPSGTPAFEPIHPLPKTESCHLFHGGRLPVPGSTYQVALPHYLDRAGLRTLVASLLAKTHLLTELQPVEQIVEDAVSMEVDGAAIGCLDATVVVFHLAYTPGGRTRMGLDLVTPPACLILQLSVHRIEGIANGHVDIRMSLALHGSAPRRSETLSEIISIVREFLYRRRSTRFSHPAHIRSATCGCQALKNVGLCPCDIAAGTACAENRTGSNNSPRRSRT